MKKIKKYIILLISLLFAALNFNLILKPLNLVTGGTQGLAIIINHLTNFSSTLIIFTINIIALILSLLLPKKTTYSIIIASFIYPLFIKLTSNLPPLNFNVLFLSFLAGIVCGTTGGLIYKEKFSSGGITIINLLLQKYLKIKVSITNFIINVLIIFTGYFYFGLSKSLYSLIVVTTSSIIIHFIMKK